MYSTRRKRILAHCRVCERTVPAHKYLSGEIVPIPETQCPTCGATGFTEPDDGATDASRTPRL